VLAACAPPPAPPTPGGDLLVLELGGEGPSLREALARRIARRAHAGNAPASGRLPATSPTPQDGSGRPRSVPGDRRDPEPAGGPAPAPEHPALPDPGSAVEPRGRPPEPEPPAVAPPSADLPAGREKPAVAAAPARRVRLRAGQTLYRLACEHLGDGKRWQEIAALNGWSESDVASLRADTEVALPPR
jgi:hypothetical protein